ncbi:MAG: DUF2064 domain-containing protein [Acidobacteriota bacterium]
MAQADSALVLFTLSPEAEGKRKPLGLGRPEQAAAVFATLLRHVEKVCSGLPDVDLLLASPGGPPKEGRRHLTQRGRNFGESLRLAVEDALALGYRRVAVIGNDAPEISRSYLQEAFTELVKGEGSSAVLGPARDGGYVLLGLSSPCPRAFESMPWGSRRVARLTEERLVASGFRVARLIPLEDIDNRRSLARFIARARKGALYTLAVSISVILSPAWSDSQPSERRCKLVLVLGWPSLRAPPTLVCS